MNSAYQEMQNVDRLVKFGMPYELALDMVVRARRKEIHDAFYVLSVMKGWNQLGATNAIHRN